MIPKKTYTLNLTNPLMEYLFVVGDSRRKNLKEGIHPLLLLMHSFFLSQFQFMFSVSQQGPAFILCFEYDTVDGCCTIF